MGAGKTRRTIYPGAIIILLAGCADQQSALNPAGEEARSVYDLFLVMAAGAAVIWLIVVGLTIYAFRESHRPHRRESSQALILWGGGVFPSVVLLLLLGHTLWLMPNIRPWFDGPESGNRVEITGEQYWWRIRYLDAKGGLLFETANELRLPVGEPTILTLRSSDVIHSFWIPALGGKMDMIPGRTNRLILTPTRTGMYRGPCAEFCGTSHALMNVMATVMEKPQFEDWVAVRRAPAQSTRDAGARLFIKHGCPACHAVEGLEAMQGRVGPNLTALAERQTIGAGTLKNTSGNLILFIRNPAAVKPGATMPAFDMLPREEIAAIAAWLGDLK